MGDIEVDISTQLDVKIEQMIDEGEFLNRKEAVEELLSAGLRTYQTEEDSDEGMEFADEMRNPGEEPMGPAAEDGQGRSDEDEYSF
jgi:Arc/MetJ-type ribon-helix-helix transcriptional regulator